MNGLLPITPRLTWNGECRLGIITYSYYIYTYIYIHTHTHIYFLCIYIYVRNKSSGPSLFPPYFLLLLNTNPPHHCWWAAFLSVPSKLCQFKICFSPPSRSHQTLKNDSNPTLIKSSHSQFSKLQNTYPIYFILYLIFLYWILIPRDLGVFLQLQSTSFPAGTVCCT